MVPSGSLHGWGSRFTRPVPSHHGHRAPACSGLSDGTTPQPWQSGHGSRPWSGPMSSRPLGRAIPLALFPSARTLLVAEVGKVAVLGRRAVQPAVIACVI